MKWYLGAGLLLLAALILQSGLLAYAMYVLWGLLLLSRFLARSWIGNVKATRECGNLAVEIGETIRVAVTIQNRGALPVPWVLLEDVISRQAIEQKPPRLRVQGKRLQILALGPGQRRTLRYKVTCQMRGYYQIGPLILESGDLFGLHRRYRVETEPCFVLVYPQVMALEGYELASRRPIGDVRLTHRLYEDPTRIAGVRPYEAGDPLNRVHWRATARTGQLHCKVYEPSTLTGATILLDFHQDGYPRRGEPYRSELAVTTAVSLANAVYELGQQIGLISNGRDAADRLRLEGWEHEVSTRQLARRAGAMRECSERLDPVVVETRRGIEQLQRIRETLARVELTDGLTFAQLISEATWRLPRDATILALLPAVSVESALALGNLRRQGLAVTAILIGLGGLKLEQAHGRLLAEGIRDVRNLAEETGLAALCQQQVIGRGAFIDSQSQEAKFLEESTPEWLRQSVYELDSPENKNV